MTTCTTAAERRKFFALYVNCTFLAVTLCIPMPYFAGAALILICFLIMTWVGIPVIASAISVSAVVPLMIYPVTNVAGVQTLILVSTPIIIVTAALIARILFPGQFIRRTFSSLDWVVVVFAVSLGVLYSRGTPISSVLRTVVENVLTLAAFYFIASRGRTGPPLFVLRAIVFVGLALAAIAVSEVILGWLQFADATVMRGAPSPYLLTPYTFERFGLGRSLTTFTDAIACGIFLAISVICAFSLYLAEPKFRLIWLGVICITTTGVLSTFSRNGVLIIACGLTIYLFLARRYVFAALSVVIGGAIALVIANNESTDIVSSTEYRSRILDLIPLIAKKNLIFGDNTLPYQADMTRFVQGQGIVDLVNTYLFLFVNGGLLLIFLFMTMPVLAIKHMPGLRVFKRNTDSILYRKSALAICLSLYVGLIFTSPTDKNLVYLMCALGIMRGIGLYQVEAASLHSLAKG